MADVLNAPLTNFGALIMYIIIIIWFVKIDIKIDDIRKK